MAQGRIVIIVLVTLIVGFAAGFVLRPIIIPPMPTAAIAPTPADLMPAPAEARGIQYFAAHLEEARAIVERCRAGAVRGDECANPDAAIVRAEARDRSKRFLGN